MQGDFVKTGKPFKTYLAMNCEADSGGRSGQQGAGGAGVALGQVAAGWSGGWPVVRAGQSHLLLPEGGVENGLGSAEAVDQRLSAGYE